MITFAQLKNDSLRDGTNSENLQYFVVKYSRGGFARGHREADVEGVRRGIALGSGSAVRDGVRSGFTWESMGVHRPRSRRGHDGGEGSCVRSGLKAMITDCGFAKF